MLTQAYTQRIGPPTSDPLWQRRPAHEIRVCWERVIVAWQKAADVYEFAAAISGAYALLLGCLDHEYGGRNITETSVTIRQSIRRRIL